MRSGLLSNLKGKGKGEEIDRDGKKGNRTRKGWKRGRKGKGKVKETERNRYRAWSKRKVKGK